MEGTVGACCILMLARPMQYGRCVVLTLADAVDVGPVRGLYTPSLRLRVHSISLF